MQLYKCVRFSRIWLCVRVFACNVVHSKRCHLPKNILEVLPQLASWILPNPQNYLRAVFMYFCSLKAKGMNSDWISRLCCADINSKPAWCLSIADIVGPPVVKTKHNHADSGLFHSSSELSGSAIRIHTPQNLGYAITDATNVRMHLLDDQVPCNSVRVCWSGFRLH